MFNSLAAAVPVGLASRQGIDFNILDSIGGSVITLAAVALLLFLLFKYKVFTLGNPLPAISPANSQTIVCPEKCPAHAAEHERSLENKDKIAELFRRTHATEQGVSEIKADIAAIKVGNEAILREVTKLTK